MRVKNLRRRFVVIVAMLFLIIFTVVMLTGCGIEPTPITNSSYQESAEKNEEAVKDLISNDSLPQIEKSLERENIKRRIEFINQPDRIGYLYLLSDSGQLIREVQVLGKVSSLNSYLTPMEQIEWFKDIDLGDGWGDVAITTQAPDLDGTYGENAEGVFWFDADGVYQEWNGLYHYSSQRLTFSVQPILIEVTTE